MPPPHLRSGLSLNWALKLSESTLSLFSSSLFTFVKATTAAFFLFVSVPSLALPLTMQNGISILRQRAGSHTTSSMGLTSWAIATILAFFVSIRWVMCFSPYLSTSGGTAAGGASPAAVILATSSMRDALASLVSGWYFTSSLKSSAAWFLSKVVLNWWSAGGTFSL